MLGRRHERLVGQRAGIPRVPVALHLAPHPAHRVLADLSTKYAAKCAAHAARIGTGQIRARTKNRGRCLCRNSLGSFIPNASER
jgi:hypothetical protein